MTICIVDTSVLLNVLNVPGRADDRTAVLGELDRLVEEDAELLLPLAAIFETGNHVSRLSNGSQRRRVAHRFAEQVHKAVAGDAPWTVTPLPELDHIRAWLTSFPDHAKGGLSLADAAMVDEWERQRARWPQRRVLIWSLDRHLSGYDAGPT